jgi:hypothetical protein
LNLFELSIEAYVFGKLNIFPTLELFSENAFETAFANCADEYVPARTLKLKSFSPSILYPGVVHVKNMLDDVSTVKLEFTNGVSEIMCENSFAELSKKNAL